MNKDAWIYAIGIIVVISFGAWWQYSIWTECRQTNSFMYCLHLMGHR